MSVPRSQAAVNEVRLRVRYAETDRMGVAYHSNFLIWFEVGRVELLRQLGFEYRKMEERDDCHLPVVDVRCRYKNPARYDDDILVRSRLKNVRESFVRFEYEVLRAEDGTLLAEGETTHLVVDGNMERKQLPPKYLQLFEAAIAGEQSTTLRR